MNSFTNKSDFIEEAQFILDNSDLLIQSDCMIVDDVLYERLRDESPTDEKYRFFFECEDYDYLEDQDMIDRLDKLYAERDK